MARLPSSERGAWSRYLLSGFVGLVLAAVGWGSNSMAYGMNQTMLRDKVAGLELRVTAHDARLLRNEQLLASWVLCTKDQDQKACRDLLSAIGGP